MPDYNFLMDSRLRPEQLRVVNQLGRLAANQGLNLYLAGGAVRDLTLGAAGPRDLHFVVEGSPQKILRTLESKPARRGPPHPGEAEPIDLRLERSSVDSRLNLAQVAFAAGVRADIAASRSEAYLSPGRPPVISPGTIFDDLRRRDFSVNAMAVSLHPNSRGLLLDPTNGAADLERRELRALQSRSFFDDPVRLYRLLRLSQRLDFKPDEKTERWLGLALDARVWESIPDAAQGGELRAILEEESCGKVLKLLRDKGILGGLDRKLSSARIDFEQFERVRNAVRLAGAEDDILVLNFHALVAKLPDAEQNRLGKKILGEAKLVKLALNLEPEASKVAKLVGSAKLPKPSEIFKLLADTPRPLAVFLLVHYPQPAIQNRVKAFFTKAPALRASLPRAELEALGLAPGPKFDKVLEQVFLDQLDGKLKTPQQMTKALLGYAGIKAPPPPPPAAPAKVKGSKATKLEAPKSQAPKLEAPKAPAAATIKSAAPAAGKPAPVNLAGKPQPATTKMAPAKPLEVKHLKTVPPSQSAASKASAKGAKPPAASKPNPAKPVAKSKEPVPKAAKGARH